MAERGPLRHSGHLHQAERDADNRAQYERQQDPLVLDDAVVEQGSANGQRHAQFSGPHAAPGRGRRAEPFERQDEERRGDQIANFNDELSS